MLQEKKSPRIGIVEDEALIADNLMMYMKDFGYRVLEPVDTYESAMTMIKLGEPDLVLVDIRLRSVRSGIDIGKYLDEKKIPFIYITAQYDEATLKKAAETLPAGFITKPYTAENIHATIGLALLNDHKKNDEVVELPDGYSTVKLRKSEILYLEAEHIYVQVLTTNKKLLIRRPMKELLCLLGPQFRQVHKSFAVNLNQVSRFDSSCIWVQLHKIPVGRVFKEAMKKELQG